MMKERVCDIGLFGLGVMGRNFVLNMADRGFSVGVYNRTDQKTREFMERDVKDRNIQAGYTVKDFLSLLRPPRSVLISVPAGDPVDAVIDEITLGLEPGDLIVDMGNSHFSDTDRRYQTLTQKRWHFLGMGISGGEYGARHGPSLMPGGSSEGYERIRAVMEASAAQVDKTPCVAYLGPGSAGHYVKMVHNGIEYGIMQLIAETYDLMKRGMAYNADQLHAVYDVWNQGELKSYLMEITSEIFLKNDEKTKNPLVDMILDHARQKGTGKWTSVEALEHQVPAPTIHAGVGARDMSVYKDERKRASETLRGPHGNDPHLDKHFVDHLKNALYVGMVGCYAQGMALMKQADKTYEDALDLETVATIWRGGCIIRAEMLENIRNAYHRQPDLSNLLLDPRFSEDLGARQEDLRHVVCTAARLGIPAPALMTSLAYYDGYRSERLPANLIMAQRDYFGAHRYERLDESGTFHAQWAESEVKG
ncbi:MAG: NADP-dependent phosphogluconate dehydrogenase [Deltaproteobacteria bacterium]|nr:NADP-dependent phosphogluconate dehydrogenase [Deltaproteobacteria bacterium]